MKALHAWLASLGRECSDWMNPWLNAFSFGFTAFVGIFSPSTYNRAMRQVIEKQIYFTAWQILPGFAVFAALFSALLIEIVITTARKYALYEYALELIVRILVLEIQPLMTALFIALRTGAAINTEVALMKIQNELYAMQRMGIDPVRLELLPRVIGGTVSVMILTAVNVALSLWLTYVMVIEFNAWSLTSGDFHRIMGKILVGPALVVLLVKSLAFGFAVTVVPISEALSTEQKLYKAPVSVLRGMVRLFFTLMLIETLALAFLYA